MSRIPRTVSVGTSISGVNPLLSGRSYPFWCGRLSNPRRSPHECRWNGLPADGTEGRKFPPYRVGRSVRSWGLGVLGSELSAFPTTSSTLNGSDGSTDVSWFLGWGVALRVARNAIIDMHGRFLLCSHGKTRYLKEFPLTSRITTRTGTPCQYPACPIS